MTNDKSQLVEKTITDKEMERALENCEKEPIHIPGSIQPHGYLLVLDDQFKILKYSQNMTELVGLDHEQLLQTTMSDFTAMNGLERLRDKVIEGRLNPIRYTTLSLTFNHEPRRFNAVMHRSSSYLILELELEDEPVNQVEHQDFYQEITQFSLQLQKVQTQSVLYEFVVNHIRQLTGFDRVKLYRFDEKWNGEVIAESKAMHMPSYLGLHFPASDTPKQARVLYSKNYIRLIPDTAFRPIPITPNDIAEDDTQIDLSFSCLRSVSPVHIEYLKNMGIGASMSISVMQNGRLWGLIACHHNKPLSISYPIRMASELMAHTFSAFLSNFMQSDQETDLQSRQAYIRELQSAIAPNASLLDLLKNKHELVLRSVNADGVFIHMGGKSFTFGLTPEMSFAKTLTEWLEINCEDQIFVSHSISRDTGLAVKGQSIASGVVAVPVRSTMSDYMIWFRQEQSNEVNWAGKPEKKVTQEKSGYRLTPRSSFALWKENIRGYSKPWSKDDLEAANSIAKLLLNKKYEDSLKQADYDLQSILNNSSALVYVTDTEGRILRMNESYLKFLKVDYSRAMGSHLSKVFASNIADVFANQQAQVLNSQQSMTFNTHLTHNDQNYQFITVKFPLYDSNGDVYAFCSISTDVSTLLQTQSELERSNKELERVAFVASHDLQEPIRMIANFTKLLKDEYQNKKLDETAQDYVNFTLHSAERMRVLIQDLLQYSRVGQKEDQPVLIDSNEELNKVLDQISLADNYPNATINIESTIPDVMMKTEHFNCILQNLISNALKYSSITKAPVITVACEDLGNHWQFSVADNGIGIKQELQGKIFEIFQRLHSKHEYNGSGIGLALCSRIIERYEGKIWVDSEVDVGSTFYFSIAKNARIVK